MMALRLGGAALAPARPETRLERLRLLQERREVLAALLLQAEEQQASRRVQLQRASRPLA
jgi:hypothetical protein